GGADFELARHNYVGRGRHQGRHTVSVNGFFSPSSSPQIRRIMVQTSSQWPTSPQQHEYQTTRAEQSASETYAQVGSPLGVFLAGLFCRSRGTRSQRSHEPRIPPVYSPNAQFAAGALGQRPLPRGQGERSRRPGEFSRSRLVLPLGRQALADRWGVGV